MRVRRGSSSGHETPARSLNRNNLGSRIQTPEVIGIACNYGVSPFPGKDYHRCVDNIARVGGTAKFSTGARKLLIKRNNFHTLATQEPRQGHLNTAVSPNLSNDARRHPKCPALSQRSLEQGDHAFVTAIQGDQRAGIQHYPRRGASARSAHLMSLAVGSPYCSIRSRSSARRDSPLSCSARTRAI